MENGTSIATKRDRGSGAILFRQMPRPRQLRSGNDAIPATDVAGKIRLYRVIHGRDGGGEQCKQRENVDEAGESKAFRCAAKCADPSLGEVRCRDGEAAPGECFWHCILYIKWGHEANFASCFFSNVAGPGRRRSAAGAEYV